MARSLRKISVEEFARRLKATTAAADKRFGFFLGAGCSVSSGVPDAGTLVKEHWLPRLRDLRAPSRRDLDAWASEVLEKYDPQNPSGAYGQVIDQLFFQPEERQREIEALCDGRFPGFGYAVLSGLMTLEAGKFNVVLTTNFDDLIADALYLFTTARPLVIHHESLANYIRPTRTRPLIVKLHGDQRLSPQNTARETETVKDDIEANVRTLLHDRGLIFMGYGGNDQGIRKMVEALPVEALPLGVFWVSEREPQGIIRPWLEARNAVWVEKGDFDECMLVIRDEFQVQHPERKRFDGVFEQYTETYKTLSSRISSLPDTSPEVSVLKEVVRRTDQTFPDWRAASLEAQRFIKTDPDRAESIFEKGIAQFPQSGRLLGDFAEFTRKVRRNQVKAMSLYERAVSLEGDDSTLLIWFAHFLRLFRRDPGRAEPMYKRAVEIDLNDAFPLTVYADFLADVRRDYDQAEKLFERALSLNSSNPYTLSQFANFLQKVRKNIDRAEELLRRAVAILPSSGFILTALANLLEYDRKDADQAESLFQRAIQVDPENGYSLRCYAVFLQDIRRDSEQAENLLRRSIDVDPYDSGQMIYYAEFLSDVRKDHDRAEEQFSRALSLSPDDPSAVVPFAKFLRSVRKNEARAKELEQRLPNDSSDSLSAEQISTEA